MTTAATIVVLATLLASWALTGLVRRFALSRGILDVPIARSSHQVATPRAGGIAIVLSTTIALTVLLLSESLPPRAGIALLGGGTAVAFIGYQDDRFGVSPALRITVHFLAALWALAWLGGLPPIRFGSHVLSFGWAGYVIGAFGIVWTLNLFNFMDGIDGIAASEAVFVTAAGALLSWSFGGGVAVTALCIAAASLGFLIWNWPPARIFMGDVGSGYLGFVIAVLAIMAAGEHEAGLLVWLCLGAVFFVDATFTLGRRVARRERAHVAHRSHAYQILARRWDSHRSVTLCVLIANFTWLLPLAWNASAVPERAGWITLLAIASLILLAVLLGAGRAE
jgi:Fuc2NAc and GlcNAc transferase